MKATNDLGEIRLVFFGLNRSAQFTHNSIKKNVLEPLKDAGYKISAFGAFMSIDGMVVNERSRETGIKINNNFSSYIPLDGEVYIDQARFDLDSNFPSIFRGCTDPWGDGYQSLKNLFRYMYSLKIAYELARAGADRSARFIFLRPDLYYHNRINVEISVGDTEALLPTWGKFGGENDRICIAGTRAAEIYATRYNEAVDFLRKNNRIHSEEYLRYTLISKGVTIKPTLMYATRIRADGMRSKEDFGRVHAVPEIGFLSKLRLWFGIKKFNYLTPFKT